ncbi:MAG: type I methionyl aminopeptidase [Bacilli bacterium]|nr:type I methionyl aminopeptidase [Bacilli bacterium]
MIIIKSPREIELIKKAGEVVSDVFKQLEPLCIPGVSTLALANKADQVIRSHGAIPTFLNYEGYPGVICISVNDTVVHGIPSKHTILRDGDVVSLDVGATLNGYVADACRTYVVGRAKESTKKLVRVTEESFYEGVKLIKEGVHLGDVSHAIQTHVEKNGFSVIRDYTGHGVGRHLHEDPSIPNYGEAGTGVILKAGMCLAIEPMVAEGDYRVKILSDGWTAKMKDGKLSSHYENTLVVTKDGYEILTQDKEIK